MEYLFLLGRILFGGYFVLSGYNHFKNLKGLTSYAQSKGVPMPKVAVVFTGFMMFVGGFGVLSGAYIELSVLLLALFLLVTTMQMHQYWKAGEAEKMPEKINFMKNMALLGAVLMLLAIPVPWILSLF